MTGESGYQDRFAALEADLRAAQERIQSLAADELVDRQRAQEREGRLREALEEIIQYAKDKSGWWSFDKARTALAPAPASNANCEHCGKPIHEHKWGAAVSAAIEFGDCPCCLHPKHDGLCGEAAKPEVKP